MYHTITRRMVWGKRHEKATNVPRLSPVPSGTEEQRKATPCDGKYLPAHIACKGTGDPNSQQWSWESLRDMKELRWHM